MAGKQLRKLLDETGKLEQIYRTRRSGAANNAKDWMRAWLDLDNDPYAAPCPSIHTLDNIKPLFEGITADYIIFGHEHIKYELRDQNITYYCIDTLGLKEPGDYLVIDCNEERIEFNYKHLDFDMDSEISLIDNAGYPYDKSKIRKKK